jgi:hypothetical protein
MNKSPMITFLDIGGDVVILPIDQIFAHQTSYEDCNVKGDSRYWITMIRKGEYWEVSLETFKKISILFAEAVGLYSAIKEGE